MTQMSQNCTFFLPNILWNSRHNKIVYFSYLIPLEELAQTSQNCILFSTNYLVMLNSLCCKIFYFHFWAELGGWKSLINLNLCKGPAVMSRLEENAEKLFFSHHSRREVGSDLMVNSKIHVKKNCMCLE